MKSIVLAFVLLAGGVHAALITDGILNGTNYVLAANSTNVLRGTTGNTVYDLSKTTKPGLQLSFTCPNANKMKVGDGPTITFDGCITNNHADNWITNALLIVVPAVATQNGTNVIYTNLPVQFQFPSIRIGEIWNTNVSGTNFNYIRARCWELPGI